MKLYHRFSRFAFRRTIPKKYDNRFKWAMRIKPGDMINDCTGFNRYVIETEIEKVYWKRGWFILDVDFDVADDKDLKFAGSCSLKYCGVEPAISREDCEKNHLEFLENWMFKTDGARTWYGCDLYNPSPEHKEIIEKLFNELKILLRGGHISDENGVKLPEFKHGL